MIFFPSCEQMMIYSRIRPDDRIMPLELIPLVAPGINDLAGLLLSYLNPVVAVSFILLLFCS